MFSGLALVVVVVQWMERVSVLDRQGRIKKFII